MHEIRRIGVFGLVVGRLVALPGQAGVLHDGSLIVRAANVAQLGKQAGAPDWPQARNRVKRLGQAGQFGGKRDVQGLELGLETSNAGQGCG